MITWITRNSWKAVAVSKIGAAHERVGMPCQDASRYFIDSDTLIACVADGAGSARHSAKGSCKAVDEFITVSKDRLQMSNAQNLTDVASQAFDAAREAVLKTADGDPREYATTFLGLIATRDAFAVIQLGDGAVIIDGELLLDANSLDHGDPGEYINETRFITETDAKPRKFEASKKATRVAMLTDGLENIAIINNGYVRVPHSNFFDPFYEWLADSSEDQRGLQLGQFLVSERVRQKTSDDVTLLLAMR